MASRLTYPDVGPTVRRNRPGVCTLALIRKPGSTYRAPRWLTSRLIGTGVPMLNAGVNTSIERCHRTVALLAEISMGAMARWI